MRKLLSVFIITLILFSSAEVIESEDKLRVLVYEVSSRLSSPLFESTGSYGYGNAARTLRKIASFDTKWSTPQGVTYSILRRYDVLIVVPRGGTITPEEVDAIKEYVNDGGGLLFLADSYLWDTTIPAAFDVTFLREGIYDRGAEQFKSLYQFYVSDITQHPITENVEQIALDNGYPITSYSKGDILVKTSGTSYITGVGRGPFNILLGIKDIGKGRAVFLI